MQPGPPVIRETVAPERLAARCGQIVDSWVKAGFGGPGDFLIVGPHSSLARSGLGAEGRIWPWRAVEGDGAEGPGRVPYLSIGKAKGLDALGVLAIDLPDPVRQPQVAFAAATRARQLLACLFVAGPGGTATV